MTAVFKPRPPMALSDVRAAMIAKLATSDLDERDAKLLQVKPFTAKECQPLKLPATKAGFLIPYFDMRGKPLKFFRFRYMEDTRTGFQAATGRKPLRYAQPKNTPVEVYLPPNIDWPAVAADAEQPLLITEGELKAACACKHGLACLGLGGVWSFQVKENSEPLLPVFKEFVWEGRVVYIVYDSDAATNPDVVAAELRLAHRLLELGANVFVARIPMPEVGLEGEQKSLKLGLDDYVMRNGIDAFNKVLESAIEFSSSKALHELSKRVVYVRDPGLIFDHQTRQRISPSAFKEHAFSNLHYYEERVTKTGTTLVKMSTAKEWIEWEHRAEVPGVSFAPGEGNITDQGRLNTWQGWGLPEPMEGDVKEWHRLLKHLFADSTCTQDDGTEVSSIHYFTQWCAYPLQHPGAKMHVAAAVWGPVHGSGKTLVGETLMRIYGPKHSTELKDSTLEDDRFEWAENRQFVLADDITARGDRKFMRKLMTMVTQHSMRMNPKYVPSYDIEDRINYYFTSNDPDALFMDDQDRRFFVHEVEAGKFDYRSYVQWMKSGSGPAALWHYLLEYDLTGFDPYAPAPTTQGKRTMISVGKSELGAWVEDFKANTDLILDKAKLKGDILSLKQLHMLYDPNTEKRTTPNALGKELRRSGFKAPATGSPLKDADGRSFIALAVRNVQQWETATWKQACEHYSLHNPLQPGKAAGRKF
jgi:hypothetical protein